MVVLFISFLFFFQLPSGKKFQNLDERQAIRGKTPTLHTVAFSFENRTSRNNMRNDESLQLGNRREAAFSQMTCMIQELKKQKEKKRKDDQTVRVATRTEAGKRRSEFVLPRWKAPRTCPQSYVHDKLMLHMQTDTLTCHSLPLNLENKVPLKNRKRQRRP